MHLAICGAVCWARTVFQRRRSCRDTALSLCGTRLPGTVRNLAEDQLSGEEAVMENYYSSENSYSWEFAMTGMAINTVISFHFRCGVQPKAGADEASECTVTVYPAHLWDSSNWNCQRRTTVLSKAFSQVHGIFKIITRKKGLAFWRICQKSSAQWEDENGFILPETPTSTLRVIPKIWIMLNTGKTTDMLSFLDRHPWRLRITITSNMSYWSRPPRLVNNKSCLFFVGFNICPTYL